MDMLDLVAPTAYHCADSWPAIDTIQPYACAVYTVAASTAYAVQVSMDPSPGFALRYGLVSASSLAT